MTPRAKRACGRKKAAMPKVKPNYRIEIRGRAAYWKFARIALPGVLQRLKENVLSIARQNGLSTLGKNRFEKSIFPTDRQRKIALDKQRSLTDTGDSRAAMLTETTHNRVQTSAKQRKGLHMCTLTHFFHPHTLRLNDSQAKKSGLLPLEGSRFATPAPARFQVVLAGNAFFHIKETSTGHVRGFRRHHNEACALARSLELHH